MPIRQEHLKKDINPFQPKEYIEQIHKFMDSTAQNHPGDAHRTDWEHSMVGVESKFGSRATLTYISHEAEDMKSDLIKGKKNIRF